MNIRLSVTDWKSKMWQDYTFMAKQTPKNPKPRVGISACLTGEAVRYDGTHKKQPNILNALQPALLIETFCPEVAIGMGVPRPPIQLVIENNGISALPVDEANSEDFTQGLSDYAQGVITNHGLADEQPLCGYIFKSRSPSCGLGSTPIFNEGNQVGFGDGIYAHEISSHLPWLPLAEEEDLSSQDNSDYFIFRALLIHDLHISQQRTEGLRQFHSHHHALLALAPHQSRTQLKLELKRSVVSPNKAHYAYAQVLNELLNDLGPVRLKGLLTSL